MTRSIAEHEVAHAAAAVPHGPAADRAEPLHAPWMPSGPGNLTDTSSDGHHDRARQLAIAPPPARPSEHGAHATPKSSFFICHTLRCGSTLLCDALSSTGVAGHAEEYFPERTHAGGAWVATGAALRHPDTWRCDWTTTPFEQCIDRVLRSGTTPNGVFASKVKWFNMPSLGEMLGLARERAGSSLAEHLDGLFPNLRYVWVTRRDKVRQAVSLVKARQSTQWKAMSAQPPRSDAADYNFHVIDLALRRIVHEECAWGEYFTRARVTPFTIVYEDLVRNYESTVRGLLDDLELCLPREYVFPAPRLQKQADALSEQWVARYHRDARSSRTWRTVTNLPALVLKQRLRETYIVPRLRDHIDRLREPRGNGRRQLTRIVPQPSARDRELRLVGDAHDCASP
jgi:trehalose 2-sulfotransferase